jgi:hypothetical protein
MLSRKRKIDILETKLWSAAIKLHHNDDIAEREYVNVDVEKTMRLIKSHYEQKNVFKSSQSDLNAWRIVTIAAAVCLIFISLANVFVEKNDLAQSFLMDYLEDYDIGLLLQ